MRCSLCRMVSWLGCCPLIIYGDRKEVHPAPGILMVEKRMRAVFDRLIEYCITVEFGQEAICFELSGGG